MKWGVRKDRKKSPSGQNESKIKKRVKEEMDSLKRERQWKKSLKNLDSMSSTEINQLSNRIRLENDFKRLKKSKVATRDDKKEYRNRANISDKDLNERVNRLRARDNLSRNVSDASREQREMGKKAIKVAASIGIKYALTGKITTKDVGMALLNPNQDVFRSTANTLLDKHNRDIVVRRNR